MSLSKYYKSSDSFQPDELVKPDSKQPTGWQSEKQETPGPFRAQEPPAQQQHLQPEQTATEQLAPAQPQPQQQSTHHETEEIDPQGDTSFPDEEAEQPPPPQQPAEPQIDLSKYVEKNIAEQQIEDAYQQGILAGKKGVEQDFVTATRSLLNICQQLDTVRETIIGNSSEELQNFALSIAERILRFSVRQQDQTIVATIEEALQRAVKSDEFTVYINPDDYQTVADHSDDIVAGLTGLNKIVIKQDGNIERGGAKIESENCTIDATIASQFDVIKEEIMKNL